VGKKQKESERHQKQDKTIQDGSVQSGDTVLTICDHNRIPGAEKKITYPDIKLKQSKTEKNFQTTLKAALCQNLDC